MTNISYRGDDLYVEDVALTEIAAKFGTPCYVYSKSQIQNNLQAYMQPLKNSGRSFALNYSVKANSNLAILNLLAKLGANFDVVSGGEIDRVLAAGGKGQNIIFSGVGKSSAEISHAIDVGVYSIHVESIAELERIQDIAKQKNKPATIALRVNPDVHAHSHPYISTGSKDNKFGIAYQQAIATYKQAAKMSHIIIKGIACHVGSQLTSLDPILEATDQLLAIIEKLNDAGIHIEYIDIGGGLGICYKDEQPPTPEEYVNAIVAKIKSTNLELHIEPGRSIVANAGLLLTKVEYLKQTDSNNFAIVDAAMNDLIRPALYSSYHAIIPVHKNTQAQPQEYSIVGPVCESGDFFAHKRSISVTTGELLAIKDAGAYGYSMSSNYNSRPRCAEILIDGQKMHLINKRETMAQLMQNEIIIHD
jgi:diaminopimelate decarboxylase